MIPLYKLEKLPRTQKLRKIAKFFGMAENRLCLTAQAYTEIYSASEFVFFHDAVKLLMNDALFSADDRRAFKEAAVVFEKSAEAAFLGNVFSVENEFPNLRFRRALNSVKHILLIETGSDQADWDFTEFDSLLPGEKKLDPAKRQIFKGMLVYLEDIRSPFNVGAMFRTCESFGVEKIILSPFCADPNHRRAQRTAMGCIDIIPWERKELFAPKDARIPSESTTFWKNELCKSELPVFALETGGIPINEFSFPKQGMLIAGSEELGVSPNALAAADASLGRVSIPCYGTKASLNVSVAFGIALQAWVERAG